VRKYRNQRADVLLAFPHRWQAVEKKTSAACSITLISPGDREDQGKKQFLCWVLKANKTLTPFNIGFSAACPRGFSGRYLTYAKSAAER
jgi:hypothetical protein